jgi:hypothetical protein
MPNIKTKLKAETPYVPIDIDDNETVIVTKKAEFGKSSDNIEKVKKSISMKKAVKWHIDEYAKQTKFKAMPNIDKAKIDNSKGSSLRMNSITTLKYTFNINTMDTIVVVMKLYDYNLKKETNYGTLFCEMIDNIPPVRRNLIPDNNVSGKVAFVFYSASPSHISADGEYRSKFSQYRSLSLAKNKFNSLWMDLEDYMTSAMSRRNWSLYTNFFYPQINQKTDSMNIEFAVKNELVSTTLLIISWFHAIFEEVIGMSKSHINREYTEIFLNYKDEDVKFMKGLINKYSSKMLESFKANVSHTTTRFYDECNYMQCGYKMIPLNVKELHDPMKLRYKPWREYFISAKCNDLVVNSVSPSFAIILDWFYIKNSTKGLYDNKSQYDRMKHSELAKNILKSLYEAQRGTYFAAEDTININKSGKQIKQWVNNKFRKLNSKISKPIDYSIEEIIMSDVTLAFASEFVGRTFADSFKLLHNNNQFNQMLGCPLSTNGYNMFAKYMFDICYGLLCANKRLGVIHGDLHLNNATIGQLYYLDQMSVNNKNHVNKTVYVINDDYQYVFPNNGYYASIIDFSRGIINPDFADKFRDTSLPRTQELITDLSEFRNCEVHNLLNLYIQLFPNKERQRDELVVLFKNNFEAVFKLLTCIDIYMFTIRLSRMLGRNESAVNKKAMKLLDNINRLAESYIATDMNHLFNETEVYKEKIIDSEYPIQTIIKKCFSEFNDGKEYKSIGIITDVYILDNPLTYSVDRYQNFPEIIKHVKYIDDDGKENAIKIVSEKRKANRKEYEKQKTKNLDIVNFIARRNVDNTDMRIIEAPSR